MKNEKKLKHIAKNNGYINMLDMLAEYGMFPIAGKFLKKEIDTKKMDKIANENGYANACDMLYKCGMLPSVQKSYKDLHYNKKSFKITLLKEFIECMRKRS